MVILISGPLGSGKSTLAWKLKVRLPHPAIIEPDTIRNFIAEVPIDKAVPIVLEITALAAKNLTRKGFNVIVPYPLSEKNYAFLQKRLRGEKVHCFVLCPRREIIQRGRGQRKLTRWEKRRIQYHYKIKLHNPAFGITIDNTRKTPAETAAMVLKIIKQN